jgi:hypothetical protein
MDKYLQVKDLKWWKKPLEKSLRFQGTKKNNVSVRLPLRLPLMQQYPGLS